MSLIKKFVMVCNKCGKESQVTNATESNVNILGEDFFLCDDCLYYILDAINGKSIPIVDEPGLKMSIKSYGIPVDPLKQAVKKPLKSDPDQDEKDKIEFEELTDWGSDDEPTKKIVPDLDPKVSKKADYIRWDDYEIEKIVECFKQGMTLKEISIKRKLTHSQIQNLVHRIKNAKPDSKYYIWKCKYGDILEQTIKSNMEKPTTFTEDLVEQMFDLREQGLSWNEISIKLNLIPSSIYAFTRNLRMAKPGSRLYELAKKYGYIDD